MGKPGETPGSSSWREDLMDKLASAFALLGLSRFAAEVYLKLLENGPMSLSGLSESLGVKISQAHLYLRELIAHGLVEVSYGKPNLYKAVSPNVLESLVEEKIASLRTSVIKRLDQLYQETLRRGRQAEKERLIYILRNWASFTSRVAEVVDAASTDLVVCGDMLFVEKMLSAIEEKERSGVNTYVLVYEVPGIPVDVSRLAGLSRVKRYVSGDLLVIADSSIAAIAQRRYGPYRSPAYGLIVEEPVIIDYIQQDFFSRWFKGVTIREDPVRTPAKFTIFRLALYEIRRLIKSGCKPEVHIYGTWVKSGLECEVKGIAVDVVFDSTPGIAQLVIDTPEGRLTVGAQDAIIEDIAAHEVHVRCV
ncbi:hypothetical protein ATG_13940 [Desulfurococcaceae archaeon AG1]|nr:MAG: hypothetical protein DJ555_06025 [Desulfurococcaceae archaeon]GAY26191.1 hypothetical protein ATG_13940 [Desulfurococcaceae archaeon AG1]